ncbi:hypothetical protein ACQ4PT_019006 [Festuca glaucescens]
MAARVFLSSSRIASQLAAANNCGVRSYSAAAAAMTRQEPSAPAAARRLAAAAQEPPKRHVFWMREPKTGYWMPENHFQDVDPADLRARLLFSRK